MVEVETEYDLLEVKVSVNSSKERMIQAINEIRKMHNILKNSESVLSDKNIIKLREICNEINILRSHVDDLNYNIGRFLWEGL